MLFREVGKRKSITIIAYKKYYNQIIDITI
jgi:hypothetical protein